MAQARRRSSGSRRGRRRVWLTLGLGVGIGVLIVLLWQFVDRRWHSREGVASLFSTPSKTAPARKAEETRKPAEPPKSSKARYDFYTILPETETLLPERGVRTAERAAKAERTEPGVSYVLQAGSFNNFKDADELKARLALAGLVAQIQRVSIEGRGDYYRVRLGPYEKLDKLDATEQRLKQLGITRTLALKIKKPAG